MIKLNIMKVFFDENKLEAGVDEVARGCLAGPVFSAAVIWPKELDIPYEDIPNIKDSKKLSRKRRAYLRDFIEENALDFSVAYVESKTIDKINILNASHLAMHRAIKGLNITPELLLVDGNSFKPYYDDGGDVIDHQCVIEGDNKYISIACASILAKEYHDDYIKDLCKKEPQLNVYDWSNNMCYGTQIHINAIKQNGISKYHRKTFGICKNYI